MRASVKAILLCWKYIIYDLRNGSNGAVEGSTMSTMLITITSVTSTTPPTHIRIFRVCEKSDRKGMIFVRTCAMNDDYNES